MSDFDKACDLFWMYDYKIHLCPDGRPHDHIICPFVHRGDHVRRRHPQQYHYHATPCRDFPGCGRGDGCRRAHGSFESLLHPTTFHTRLCDGGLACHARRGRICLFAHTPEELRPPHANNQLLPPPQFPPPPAFRPPPPRHIQELPPRHANQLHPGYFYPPPRHIQEHQPRHANQLRPQVRPPQPLVPLRPMHIQEEFQPRHANQLRPQVPPPPSLAPLRPRHIQVEFQPRHANQLPPQVPPPPSLAPLQPRHIQEPQPRHANQLPPQVSPPSSPSSSLPTHIKEMVESVITENTAPENEHIPEMPDEDPNPVE